MIHFVKPNYVLPSEEEFIVSHKRGEFFGARIIEGIIENKAQSVLYDMFEDEFDEETLDTMGKDVLEMVAKEIPAIVDDINESQHFGVDLSEPYDFEEDLSEEAHYELQGFDTACCIYLRALSEFCGKQEYFEKFSALTGCNRLRYSQWIGTLYDEVRDRLDYFRHDLGLVMFECEIAHGEIDIGEEPVTHPFDA